MLLLFSTYIRNLNLFNSMPSFMQWNYFRTCYVQSTAVNKAVTKQTQKSLSLWHFPLVWLKDNKENKSIIEYIK